MARRERLLDVIEMERHVLGSPIGVPRGNGSCDVMASYMVGLEGAPRVQKLADALEQRATPVIPDQHRDLAPRDKKAGVHKMRNGTGALLLPASLHAGFVANQPQFRALMHDFPRQRPRRASLMAP